MRVLHYPFDKPMRLYDTIVQNVRLVIDPDLGVVAKFNRSGYAKGPVLAAMTGNSKRTIAYWCKMDETSGMAFIHSTGEYMKSGWATTVLKGGSVRLSANRFALSTRINAKTNTWYHVCETHDGGTYSLYMDGVLMRSGRGRLNTARDNLYVGTNPSQKRLGFVGKLSDFRVYDHSMSSRQVAALYELDAKRLAKEIPGKIHLKSFGSTSLSCKVEGDPDVNYRVAVDDKVFDNIKAGDLVQFQGLKPGTNYMCKLYKTS